MSTSTQEAVYIYQASARAAGKLHDEHIRNLAQTEALPTSKATSRDHWKKNKKQPLLPPPVSSTKSEGLILTMDYNNFLLEQWEIFICLVFR